jgi:hypothetical protein
MVSGNALDYLTSVVPTPPVDASEAAIQIWHHVLAIGHSPAYLTENADGIRQDWPRIPLPDSGELLQASAALGAEIAALLDVDTPVPRVTTGATQAALRTIGVLATTDGKNLSGEGDELALTVGWGHAGKGNATMPGRGKTVERDYKEEERAAIEAGAMALGLNAAEAFARLGATTLDVYLNGGAYWSNVPSGVWEYYIGGYQVLKKWLSYREQGVLGRALTMEEARYVMEMTRRLAAIVLRGPALDGNYRQVKAHTYPWPQTE